MLLVAGFESIEETVGIGAGDGLFSRAGWTVVDDEVVVEVVVGTTSSDSGSSPSPVSLSL